MEKKDEELRQEMLELQRKLKEGSLYCFNRSCISCDLDSRVFDKSQEWY